MFLFFWDFLISNGWIEFLTIFHDQGTRSPPPKGIPSPHLEWNYQENPAECPFSAVNSRDFSPTNPSQNWMMGQFWNRILNHFPTKKKKYGKNPWKIHGISRLSRLSRSMDPTSARHPQVDMKSIDALREMKDKLQTALKANGNSTTERSTKIDGFNLGVQWVFICFHN